MQVKRKKKEKNKLGEEAGRENNLLITHTQTSKLSCLFDAQVFLTVASLCPLYSSEFVLVHDSMDYWEGFVACFLLSCDQMKMRQEEQRFVGVLRGRTRECVSS